MKDFWDSRYGEEKEFVYGKEPNVFFADQLGNIPPGKLLLPCEGEGRNAVFAAALGWEVDAIDFSDAAREKALAFAKDSGVNMKYYLAEIESFKAPSEFYDAVGLVYAHFHSAKRKQIHAHLLSLLKPGGWVIMEAFSKKQMPYKSGGPKDEEMLYDLKSIKEDFQSLKKIIFQEMMIELDEGDYHRGKAMVVRFVGKKII